MQKMTVTVDGKKVEVPMGSTILEAAKVLGVTPDYFLQADHFNGIQPWRVNRDGSIVNALF